jgi:hypothetical protein
MAALESRLKHIEGNSNTEKPLSMFDARLEQNTEPFQQCYYYQLHASLKKRPMQPLPSQNQWSGYPYS